MGQWVGRIIGVVLVLVGGLWTLQGLSLVGGSFMTGSAPWLVIGVVPWSSQASPCSSRRPQPPASDGRVRSRPAG